MRLTYGLHYIVHFKNVTWKWHGSEETIGLSLVLLQDSCTLWKTLSHFTSWVFVFLIRDLDFHRVLLSLAAVSLLHPLLFHPTFPWKVKSFLSNPILAFLFFCSQVSYLWLHRNHLYARKCIIDSLQFENIKKNWPNVCTVPLSHAKSYCIFGVLSSSQSCKLSNCLNPRKLKLEDIL